MTNVSDPPASPEPDPDQQLICTWRQALPDTVPPFELITSSQPVEENQLVKGGENEGESEDEEIETFPCDCRYSPGTAFLPVLILSRAVEERLEECACGPLSKCINRELFIECSPGDCPAGIRCQNQRFQKRQYANVEVIQCGAKGHGLRVVQDLKPGDFVMEYVGEILNRREFRARVRQAEEQNQRHFYFMTVRNGRVIDASRKGNLARFMNHSCASNCETQKWTVGGRLRVGLFAKRQIRAGTELTFDYKFVRFGQAAQRCLCEEPGCKGFIGEEAKEPIAALAGSSDSEEDREEEDGGIDPALIGDPNASLEGPAQVPVLVKALLRSEHGEHTRDLLGLLLQTDSLECFRQFLHFHGLKVLSSLSSDLFSVDGGAQVFLRLLARLPISDKRAIDESNLQRVLSAIPKSVLEDPQIELLRRSVEKEWDTMASEYHIPHKPPPSSNSPATPAVPDGGSPMATTLSAETVQSQPFPDTKASSTFTQGVYSLEVPDEFKRKKKSTPIPLSASTFSTASRSRDSPQRNDGRSQLSSSHHSPETSRERSRFRYDERDSYHRRRSRSPSGMMRRGRDVSTMLSDTQTLPQYWHAAKSPDGQTYYFHEITKQTQWEPPTGSVTGYANVQGVSFDQALRIVDLCCDLARPGRPVASGIRDQIIDEFMGEFRAESYHDLIEGRSRGRAERFVADRLARLLR